MERSESGKLRHSMRDAFACESRAKVATGLVGAGRRARSGERVGESQGINVHAEVVVPARDRARLERLCRYVCRPPIAQNRLEEMEGGKLSYLLKKPWRDGTVALVLEPMDLIARGVRSSRRRRLHRLRCEPDDTATWCVITGC